MSGKKRRINPYKAWLGIPTEDQPPNYYRLLGLELFEADPEVIREMAGARRELVQVFGKLDDPELAEDLLREISAAESTLCCAETKAAYDQALRAAGVGSGGAASSRAAAYLKEWQSELSKEARWTKGFRSVARRKLTPGLSLPEAAFAGEFHGTADHAFAFDISQPEASEAGIFGRALASSALWRIAVVFVSVAMMLLVLFALASFRQRGKTGGDSVETSAGTLVAHQEATTTGIPPDAGAPASTALETRHAIPADSSQGSPSSSASEEIGRKVPGTRTDGSEGDSDPSRARGENQTLHASVSSVPGAESTLAPETSDPSAGPGILGQMPPSGSATAPEGAPSGVPADSSPNVPPGGAIVSSPANRAAIEVGQSVPAAVETKSPIPSAQELREAEELIRSVLSEEIVQAKTPAQKLALADRLVQLALETDDDPRVRYALCIMARNLAVENGDLSRAWSAVQLLAGRFAIEGATLKADLLDQAMRESRSVDGPAEFNLQLIELSLLAAREAAIAGQSEATNRLLSLANTVARRTNRPIIRQETSIYARAVENLLKERNSVAEAQKTLELDPTNGAAHYSVGCWLSFIEGDWPRGLNHLTKCHQPLLAAVAAEDLRGPTEPTAQLALADRWYQEAEKLEAPYCHRAFLRARSWFEVAQSADSETQKLWTPRLEKAFLAELYLDSLRFGVSTSGNVAHMRNGGRVMSESGGDTGLIDGVIPPIVGGAGMVAARWPCQWTVVLPQIYRLREIRVKLPDPGKSVQFFVLATSPDGKSFSVLADHSKVPSAGMQQFVFLSRPVKAIQLRGISHTGDAQFYASELEAYCAPALGPVGEAGRSEVPISSSHPLAQRRVRPSRLLNPPGSMAPPQVQPAAPASPSSSPARPPATPRSRGQNRPAPPASATPKP